MLLFSLFPGFLPPSLEASMSLRMHGVSSILMTRLTAMHELERKLRETMEAEQREIKELMTVVPIPRLKRWLEDEGVLETLFKFGQVSTNIPLKRDGFVNMATMRTWIEELRKVWRFSVKVVLSDHPEPHRVDIQFFPIRPFDAPERSHPDALIRWGHDEE